MKSRLLISLIFITILVGMGFYFLNPQIPQIPENPSSQKNQPENYGIEEKTQQSYKRQDIKFLKMVSSENGMYSFDDEEIEELKSLNVNTIRICPLYEIGSNGDIKLVESEKFYINLIRKAHQAGFAVMLEPNIAGPSGFPELSDPRYVDELMNIASKWAKIAEQENVEFYSPLNEPDAVFSDESLVNEWIKKSQNMRSLFSGNLVLKFADIGSENIRDIGNYDYLAFDIMWGDDRYNELKDYLKIAVKKGNGLKEEYNLKGFFFGELGAEKSMVDENTQAEIFRTILNETWGKVDGYCFLGWSDLEFSFKNNEEAKAVIREWYSR